MSRLISIAALCAILVGCANTTYSGPCPPWPVAGEKVAEELENVPYEGFEDTWAWLARLDVLRDQLDRCRE